MKLELHLSINMITGSNYISGYAKSVTGTSIDYHSSHPEAESALLIRAKESLNHISWETDKVSDNQDELLHFCWLGGIAGCQGGPHKFELWAQDKHILDIYSTKRGDKPQSELFGDNGVHLRFEHQLTDMCDDHFGLFWLDLPSCSIQEGSVCLELRGEDADSEDWMMVFDYYFDAIPMLRPDLLLSNTVRGISQRLCFGLDCLASDAELNIISEGYNIGLFPIKQGYNKIEMDIPALIEETDIQVDTYFSGILTDSRSYTLQPIKPRQVYLLPYSHNDIGYTEIQDVVADIQRRNIDKALDLIEQSRNNPDESIAKWNLEVIWILDSWWEQASESRRKEFTDAVKHGYIGLNALFANPLTGLCNLAEIQHLFDLAQWFKKQTGITIKTATVTDIPGFVWSLQPALAHNGVRYFSIAPNAGDRTGFIYKGLGDKPFWWESPCGTKRVLTWVKGAGYSQFHKEKITGNGIRKMMQYLNKLDKYDYPYEIVALPYTIGGDNGGPDEALANFVADWNSKYYSPKLFISTHERLFSDFEAKHGKDIPVLQGDMTPYWEDGALSTARETVMVRRTSDNLVALQTFAALNSPDVYDPDRFSQAWHEIMLWDEHTWGAWNSVSDPDLPFVRKQWDIKQGFALNSRKLVNDLQAAICGIAGDELFLFNSVSWPRKAFLHLSDDLVQNRQLLDEQGTPITSQKLGTEWLFDIEFKEGWDKRLVRFGNVLPALIMDTPHFDFTYKNKHFGVVFDTETGAISQLTDKHNGLQLIKADKCLGNLLYVAEGKWKNPLHCHSEKMESYIQGAICDRFVFQAELQGTKQIRLEYLFYHEVKRIDMNIHIDKLAVRDRESLHLEYPFAFPGAQLRYDSAGTPVFPESGQLPGMCRNFLSPTSYVDISNANYGITVALLDSPLIEVGSLTAEQPWLEKLEPDTVFYSYLMNNIWHTNYKADQKGLVSYRFCMLFHDGFEPSQAQQSSLALRSDVLVCSQTLFIKDDIGLIKPPKPPLLVLSVQLKDMGLWMLLLNSSYMKAVWEITGKECFLSDPAGEKLHLCCDSVEFAPYQQIWLLILNQ